MKKMKTTLMLTDYKYEKNLLLTYQELNGNSRGELVVEEECVISSEA
jgi:hypothetical protein